MKQSFSYVALFLMACPLLLLSSCKGKAKDAPLVPSVETIAGTWVMNAYESVKGDEVVQLNFKERTYFYSDKKANKTLQGKMEDSSKRPNKNDLSMEDELRYSYVPDADRSARFLTDGTFIPFGEKKSVTKYKVKDNQITLTAKMGQGEKEIGTFKISKLTADTMEIFDEEKGLDEETKQEFTVKNIYKLARVK